MYTSPSLALSRSLSLSCCLAVSLSRSLVLPFSRSLVLSFSRSLALSFSRSLALSLSRSLALSLSRSLALSLSRSLALSLRAYLSACLPACLLVWLSLSSIMHTVSLFLSLSLFPPLSLIRLCLAHAHTLSHSLIVRPDFSHIFFHVSQSSRTINMECIRESHDCQRRMLSANEDSLILGDLLSCLRFFKKPSNFHATTRLRDREWARGREDAEFIGSGVSARARSVSGASVETTWHLHWVSQHTFWGRSGCLVCNWWALTLRWPLQSNQAMKIANQLRWIHACVLEGRVTDTKDF